MNDFKRNDRFGGKRFGGGKPSFQRPGGFSRPAQGQLYPATCAQCGKATEVPFRPSGERPVYCRDCFRGTEQSAPAQDSGKRWRAPMAMPRVLEVARPVPATPDPRIDDLVRHVAKIQLKLDKILLELAVKTAQSAIASTESKPKKKSPKKRTY